MPPFNAEKIRKRNNAIVVVVSIVVMVIVVLCVVVLMERARASAQYDDASQYHALARLDTVCNFTDYKDVCKNTLAPTVGYQSEPENFFYHAVNATLVETRKVVGIPKLYIDRTKDYLEIYALQDCMEVLHLCIDEIEYVMAMPRSVALFNNSDDVRNSLSAVISYQQMCLEGLVYANSTSHFREDLEMSIKLASNSLAIEFAYSDNNDKKNNNTSLAQKNRRLLSVTAAKEDISDDVGYPAWLKIADRRLAELDISAIKPHAVVAQDGTGHFENITEALEAYPKNHTGRFIIYVKAGVYRETISVKKETPNVFMFGDGPTRTVVIGRRKNTTIYRSATFSAIGKGFICKNMGFTSAGYRPDKVALRVHSDQAAFFNCTIDGTIGPLFAVAHRQFYWDCKITGSSQIIRGDAALVIQNSQIFVKKPVLTAEATITAQSRSDRHENTGFVLHNCTILPDENFEPERFNSSTYLGIPLNKYSRSIVMESELGDFIHPEGWLRGNDSETYTAFFAEYKNNGPGAQTSNRVNWPGYKELRDGREAMQYAPGQFIQIHKWLKPEFEIPYQAGLYQ